jgi:glutathione S-transferase
LIDGDLRLTESRAIAIYIITRSGKTELLGKTPKDGAIVE